jgi:hypothetical protein
MNNYKKYDHPQYEILETHVKRCVNDIFLDLIRRQPTELLYIFGGTDDIDAFKKRSLEYWEGEEKYEICNELLILFDAFEKKWLNKNAPELTQGEYRINDLFNQTSNK